MAVAAVDVHRWTREEYERMAAEGLFAPEARVELIDGIVYDMTPQNSLHSTGVRVLEESLRRVFSQGHDIRVQLPLSLDDSSQPEPDVAVVPGSYEDYAFAHPTTAVLVVEVSDHSLLHDRKRKLPVYARNGIAEAWVMNLKSTALEVYRDPVDGVYQTRLVLQIGDTVSPIASPGAEVAVADLFFWAAPSKG